MTTPLRSIDRIAGSSTAEALSRRSFVSAAAVGGAAAGLMVHSSLAAAEESRELRLALVGCGGRGSGAINDSLTINQGVKLVAAADLYESRCATMRRAISEAHPGKVDIDDSRMYSGLDGFKRVLDDPTVDVVLITTSPGFRPRYVRAAVEAGKHVFAEKPACVDPAGYRICLEAHDAAVAKGTAIVGGTQYRRQANYIGAVEQIRQGAIGDVIGATSRYCSSGIWYRPRQEDMSDAEYQMNNWMHFIWLSGDQIAEQAVHNLDTMNWVMGGNPLSAFGSGGRFTRPADSEMWDSVSVDYEYPGNRIVSFECRQIPGAASENSNVVYGSKGTCFIGSMSSGSRIVDRDGKQTWDMAGSIADAYKQEHKDLIDSIRVGKPIVELRQMADSSMVAVLGRMAAYTGQRVTWDFATKESKLDLFPENLTWESSLPKPQHAIPGKTKLI
ncbi:MAG: Gfo/Idh/MocA family oxidoreductase [Planctomycetia bacterium]|nr:Gfo/Idh/MocA family oxidoreductase [Planctomycetia bacterium]